VLSTCQLIRQAKDGGTKDRSAAHSNAIAALDGMSWQAETDVVLLLQLLLLPCPLLAAIKLEPEIEMQSSQ